MESTGSDATTSADSSRISVVIPTRDGGPRLLRLLEALREGPIPVEIVVIDSGSTDGTTAEVRERVDRWLSLPPEEFDHGETRNRAIAASRGELVVLTVQDAIPTGDGLERLVRPLREDPDLAATWARQIPTPDASRLARATLGRWVGSGQRPHRSRIASREEFDALSPADRHTRCAFDDVCSCLRRSVWREIPFPSTPIAEDLEWARNVLLAGGEIAYVPEAVVEHSHDRGIREELARTVALHRRLRALFGLQTIPDLPALARSWATTIPDHVRILRRGDGPPPSVGEWRRALGLAVAWPLGQYLGGRTPRPPSLSSSGRAPADGPDAGEDAK